MSNEKKEMSKHKGKFVQMNFDFGGFKAGEKFLYDFAPDIIKKWADLPGILGEKRIVTVLDEEPEVEKPKHFTKCPKCGYSETGSIEPEKSLPEKNQEAIDSFPDEPDNLDRNSLDRACKGTNLDGSPCKFTGKKVLTNGYCIKHQHQAN